MIRQQIDYFLLKYFRLKDFCISVLELLKDEFLTPKLFIRIRYQTISYITSPIQNSTFIYFVEARKFLRFNTMTYKTQETSLDSFNINPEHFYMSELILDKYMLLYKTQQTYELYNLDNIFTENRSNKKPIKLCIPLLYSSRIVYISNIDEFKFQTVHKNGIIFTWDVRYPLNPVKINQVFYNLLARKKRKDKICDTITEYGKCKECIHYFTTYKYKLYIYNELSNVLYLYDNFKYKLLYLNDNYFLGYRDKTMEVFKLKINGLKRVIRFKINLEIKNCIWIKEYKQICIIGKYIKFYCFNK